jgi:hypothetical protein
MANLYYNAAVDTAWLTLGNWWNDAAFTSPAAAIPANGDTVYLSGEMTSGPSTSVTLSHIYVTGGQSMVFTGAVGNATFNDNSSRNNGTITGDATFNDNSSNFFQGIVTGDAIFNSTSPNLGIVSGNATFNGTSRNLGAVDGTNTYNDYSYNEGNNTGPSIFNDYSYNNGGVSPTNTLNDFSYCFIGTVANATFNDNSYVDTGGGISGTCLFKDSSYNNGNLGPSSNTVTFDDSSYNLKTFNSAIITFTGPYAVGRIANNSYYENLTINMTAPTGGGSDNTIARLLDLPWFINL